MTGDDLQILNEGRRIASTDFSVLVLLTRR
jgi:hypothetical protein